MTLWNSKRTAIESGFTHAALQNGVIPGYMTMRNGEVEWMAVSDLLYPVEDAVLAVWSGICWLMRREASTSFIPLWELER